MFYYNSKSKRYIKINKILAILKQNCRAKYSEISRQTGLPISTIWDLFFEIEKDFDFMIKRKGDKK